MTAFNVLFLCTGNSARSIIAEAVLNHLDSGRGALRAFSAGSHPKGDVHPLALEILEANGLPVAGLRSKSWDEFAVPGAPKMDFIFTVCDNAASEACPIWPGQPVTAHWGIPDPAAVTGTDDDKRRAFRDALVVLRGRLERFSRLPFDATSRPALERQIHEIGRQ